MLLHTQDLEACHLFDVDYAPQQGQVCIFAGRSQLAEVAHDVSLFGHHVVAPHELGDVVCEEMGP